MPTLVLAAALLKPASTTSAPACPEKLESSLPSFLDLAKVKTLPQIEREGIERSEQSAENIKDFCGHGLSVFVLRVH